MASEAAWERGRAQQFEIVLDSGANRRILNFDRNLFAGLRDGTMHLSKRGSRERFRLEVTENIFGIVAARSFELSAGQGGVHAGGAHRGVGQSLDAFFRKTVGLETEILAEFN